MLRKLTILSVILAVTAASQAAFISFFTTYSGAVPGSQTVNLPKYNGTDPLVSVQLILESFAYSGSIVWDNESQTVTEVHLGIGAQVTATGPDATTLVAVPMTTGTDPAVGVDDEAGGPDFAGSDIFQLLGLTSTDSDSGFATNLALYQGADTFGVDIDAIVGTYLLAVGGSGDTQATPGTTDGKVTVIYETIPEPATMSLLAIGGVAALIRRKK